jgi:hypothetical protein
MYEYDKQYGINLSHINFSLSYNKINRSQEIETLEYSLDVYSLVFCSNLEIVCRH